MNWRDEIRTCANRDCRVEFRPKREGQIYHAPGCRVGDAMARYRKSLKKRPKTANKSDNKGIGYHRALGGCLEAITGPLKNVAKSTPSRPQNRGVYPPWDGFRGRLRIYLHDEAPSIGTGWRSLTVRVRGKRVRLLNHWTGDARWITRETFERLAAHSMSHGHQPTKAEPVSKLLDQLVTTYTPLHLEAPKKLSNQIIPDDYPELPAFLDRRRKLRLVVDNKPMNTGKEEAA
jgi:hypothetical protein